MDILNVLDGGKEINIDDITEEHWKNFDKNRFLTFHSNNPHLSKYCKINIFVNAFYDPIIYRKDYVKKLLEVAKKNKAPSDKIDPIQEAYDILNSYLRRDLEDLKKEKRLKESMFYKAWNGLLKIIKYKK